MHQQIFAHQKSTPNPRLAELAKKHLADHDLLGRAQENTTPISFQLPPLLGTTLDEHFHKLGMDAGDPYLTLAKQYTVSDLPTIPRKWVHRSGWTKYNPDGSTELIDAPQEQLLTFDTEVMYKESPFAVMACAASPTAWYVWLSPWLLGESTEKQQLVPLGDPLTPRIVVGHNVGFDRARVLEEYDLKQSRSFYLDTMSLHVAVNGMCSQQRPTWMRHKKNRDLREQLLQDTATTDLASVVEHTMLNDEEEELWVGRSSINSLRDVAQFHCNITIDKAQREYFGELDRDGINGKLDELLDYCAADVAITHRVYKKVFPVFLETCPHPVSFAALRHLSSVILPINESWQQYLKDAEETYTYRLETVKTRLLELCEHAVSVKDQPEIYENDPWLKQLDWSDQEIKMTKGTKNSPPRPVAHQRLPGKPRWYKSLFPKKDGPMNLTVRTRTTPLLLKLAWDGYPLVWSDTYGWTFCVPEFQSSKFENQAMTKCDMMEEKNEALKTDRANVYFKLPHKDGPDARCVSPLAKGYLQHFETNRLSSAYPLAMEALEMNLSCSYWIGARDRILSQMAVYDVEQPTSTGKKSKKLQSKPKPKSRSKSKSQPKQGFILPQVIPMGTITRRAVEKTWLTASNAKPNRVGSELKAMVQAPPGYVFVGADVDSEELWIASLVGDAQFELHGGNAIGFMTLEGTKSAGTDLHSRTANILGISRNNAKVFNYGRIYGAGLKFAATLLRQFNPSMPEEKTKEVAGQLYKETKGIKTTRKLIHPTPFWRGGTESFVFNKLEEFAEQEYPRTPVLGAGITEALMRRYINRGGFMTSRINWAIQSSGVDYLHLLIVSMDFLIRRYNIDARLAISVHDEIRFLVHENDKYRAAMALQISNVWTRAMFAQQAGINDLPQSCAFFSAVDIDTVLRKEVDMDCITPSQRKPIPPGESIDIVQLLDKGKEAYLKPTEKAKIPPQPEKHPYTPRPPVMTSLGKPDPDFIRAQIAKDDKALHAVNRDVCQKRLKAKEAAQRAANKNTTATSSRQASASRNQEFPPALPQQPQAALLMDIEPALLHNAGSSMPGKMPFASSAYSSHQKHGNNAFHSRKYVTRP